MEQKRKCVKCGNMRKVVDGLCWKCYRSSIGVPTTSSPPRMGALGKIGDRRPPGKRVLYTNRAPSVETRYCDKFDDACRESNRSKYGRVCYICDKTEADNGQRLSVHHVDMNKLQGCDDHAWKLVPLCRNCHAIAHTPKVAARIQYLLDHITW